MKGRKKYLVIVILLLLISITSVTFGMYKSYAVASHYLSLAKWTIKVNSTDITYSDVNTVDIGGTSEIMPGQTYDMHFDVDATMTTMDSILMLEIDEDNLVGVTKEELDQAELSMELRDDNGPIDYATILPGGTKKRIYIRYYWKRGSEDNDEKNDIDIRLSNHINQIRIPIKVTVRQSDKTKKLVTFDTQANKTFTRNVVDGSKIAVLPTPEKEGYTFLGWFTKSVGGKQITEDTIIAREETYYAHWKENE